MQFAIDLPPFGPFSDPNRVAQLAEVAEEAGWNGFFLWDHLNCKLEGSPAPVEIADPWIHLAAIALRTTYIKLGPMVTPLPRRRPWKLARETVTLDHLCGGRLVLGVGLGSDYDGEYHDFGETTYARVHGEKLDEGLAILTRLWSGQEVSYQGQQYQLAPVQFLPTPLQRPRISIWVAGIWPHKKPFRRAAQFEGVYPQRSGRALGPEGLRGVLAFIQNQRTQTTPFEALAYGRTSGSDTAADAAHVATFAKGIQQRQPWKLLVVLVQSLVIALVLAYLLGLIGKVGWLGALGVGVLLWIGLAAMQWVGSILWENVPLKMAAIHAGDWLVKLVLIAVIVGVWR